MAPRKVEPMCASSLSMLGHSLAAGPADESWQTLAFVFRAAIGTGSRLRLMLGADTNFLTKDDGATADDRSPIRHMYSQQAKSALRTVWDTPSGQRWISHKKGRSTCG